MRRRNRPQSLYRILLSNFIGIMAISMAVMAAGTISVLNVSLSRMSIAKNSDIIESMAEDLTVMMSSVESDIEDIRILRDFTFIDDWALRSYLDSKVRNSPAIDMIQVINGSGRVVGQAPYEESMLGIDLSRHPFVLASGSRSGFVWSRSFLSPTTGRPTVTVMKRYRGYSVILYVNLGFLTASLVAEEPDAYGFAYILDRDGTYLAHPDPEVVSRRENEREDPTVLELIKAPDDSFRAVSRDRTILVLRRISPTGWIIGFRQPMAEIFPLIRTFYIVAVAVSVFAIAISTLLAIYRIRWVLSPLRTLIDAASAVSSGDYNIDLGYVPVLEVSELAHHFQVMVNAVFERESNLDQLVKERTHKLEVSLDELRQTQDQMLLQERMAALGSLVSGVAHEINTPIGIGFTAATYLRDEISELRKRQKAGSLDADAWLGFLTTSEESVRIIEKGLRQAASQIRSFKRVAVDQTGADRRLFDVRDYIDDVISILHPVWRKRDIEFDIRCPSGNVIDSFPGAFGQILNNLIMNSLIHGFPDNASGTILISVSTGDELVMEYRDDGAGMDEDVRSRVFDPFFTTRRNVGGSGLGMHVVYNLVTQLFGGAITCESSPGTGTRFRISFTPGSPGGSE